MFTTLSFPCFPSSSLATNGDGMCVGGDDLNIFDGKLLFNIVFGGETKGGGGIIGGGENIGG